MHVRCPHCQNPIEIVDDNAQLSDVVCPSCGSNFSLAPDETVTYPRGSNKTIAHFELLERVGVGAFGEVWKARDTKLDRIVALKIPRQRQLTPGEAEQFLREARAAAQLRHPRIVSVHEIGRDGESIYIVSDFVWGVPLSSRLTAGPITIRKAAELCANIADALNHAHEAGVVHRDVKPSNVMLDNDGEPHLMDFGLAKRAAGEVTITVDGTVLGTPAYMSPEQARGESHIADARSDIYSVGAVLFELLTGEKPFRGDVRMLLQQVMNDDPPSPRTLKANVPQDLETICLKCLHKEPDGRYATAAELAADLRKWLNGEPIRARPVGRFMRFWRWYERHTMVVAGGFTVFYGALSVTSIPIAIVLLAREEYPLGRATLTFLFALAGIWIGVFILRGARRALLVTFAYFAWIAISTLIGLASSGLMLIDNSALLTIQFGMENLTGAAIQLHAIFNHLKTDVHDVTVRRVPRSRQR